MIGPAGFMAGPQGTDAPKPRYVVQKEYGSEWARVMDTETGRQIAKYNILRRSSFGLPSGWERAERHVAALNRRAQQHSAGPSTK